MSSEDKSREELLKELRAVRRKLDELEANPTAAQKETPPAGPTRRDVLKAAWVSPIVLSLGLPRGAAGQVYDDGTTAAPSTSTSSTTTTRKPTRKPTNNPTNSPTRRTTHSPTVSPTKNGIMASSPTIAPTVAPEVPAIPILDPDR